MRTTRHIVLNEDLHGRLLYALDVLRAYVMLDDPALYRDTGKLRTIAKSAKRVVVDDEEVTWVGKRYMRSDLEDDRGYVTPMGLSLDWPAKTPDEDY